MSQVDLRGFQYALEPLLRKQQWRVDGLQARLAAMNKLVAAARRECTQVEAALESCAGGLRQAGGGRLDPDAYARGLAWLATLQADLEQKKLRHERLRLDREALLDTWLQAQRKVDVTSEHKDECLKEYVLTEHGGSK
jgi:glycine/D-amino acid oxidase-like deaminating enzyme